MIELRMKASKEARFRDAGDGCARAAPSIGGRHRVHRGERHGRERPHRPAARRVEPGHSRAIDEEDRLRPEFVDRVLDAVEAGDDETARRLVQPLHPADVADLIELAARDEREGLVKALAGIVSPDVLAEMNDYVREGLLDEMEPQQVADIAGQLETDDAVALIEDLDRDDQQAVLRAMEPDDRAAVEEALSYPEESAGRLMQRDLCAVPEHWKVGQVIDYLRSTADLPTDFWEVFVVSPDHHPVGTCKLSTILRTPRDTPVSDIMAREQTLIPVDMDQEDVALRFQKYALVSAAVVDDVGPAGRHDHRRRHRPHHPGGSGRGRAAALRRGRRRHQRAGPADRPPAPVLAGHQPRHGDRSRRASSACSRARSADMRCLPC